jgi:hypothetical protein
VELHFADDRDSTGFGRHWYHAWRVGVPVWLVAVVAGVISGFGALRWHRSRRLTDPGRCPTCGYDLRATPDRCPECGAIPGTAAAGPPWQSVGGHS